MAADDLIAREEFVPRRLGVQYRLTRHGRSLLPVFNALWQRGTRHLKRPQTSRGTRA
jgi:DNA-binding HxlR family transcriptional regulator